MKQADREIINLLEQIAADGGGGAETDPLALKIASNLSDLENAGTARTNLALVPGTDVQDYNVNLDTWAGLVPSANGQSLVTAANYAAMRALLDLEIGTDIQAFDADLATWAGITPGTGVGAALAINVGSAGAFVALNGALGTPSSGTLTNATGLPVATGVSGLGDGVATFLATPSNANFLAALTAKTGVVAQEVIGTNAAYSSTTTVIPADDTIPQNNEGGEVLTVTITPKNASSTLIVTVSLPIITHSSTNRAVAALFRDAGADAIGATAVVSPSVNATMSLVFEKSVAAGSTSATTFTVRAGPSAAATLFFNGNQVARYFGGVAAFTIKVKEVLP